jgi:hypothetical protein
MPKMNGKDDRLKRQKLAMDTQPCALPKGALSARGRRPELSGAELNCASLEVNALVSGLGSTWSEPVHFFLPHGGISHDVAA